MVIETEQPWPRNAWYQAAWNSELGEKPLARTIMNEKVVVFRGPNGKAAVLEDRCCHRAAPLSMGTVLPNGLQCGYHGLVFDATGACIRVPGQSSVPPGAAVRSYPVVERHGFVWVWPGDAAQADPELLPHLHWADHPEWAYGGGLYHVKADYRLMIDNLMDLTHETYVHAGSIGQPEIDETPCTTRTEGDEVITSRFMNGIQAPPFWRMALRGNGLPDDQLVDRWQICHFSPPSHVMIEVGVALAGRGGYDAPAEFKASKVVTPLCRALRPGGRLLGIHSCGRDPGLEIVRKIWPDENPFQTNRHDILRAVRAEFGKDARHYNFNAYADQRAEFRYDMHTLPTEIADSIGTSTLFAAWNAAAYVAQIDDERMNEVVATPRYLDATREVLQAHGQLWFNDESYVISRKRD